MKRLFYLPKRLSFQLLPHKTVNTGGSGFTALAVCMKSCCIWMCLQSAIMPCLALHSSNTRALEKLISYSPHWAGFFCQTRSRVKTIIVGKLAQKICSAHLICTTFSSLLSKLTVLDNRVLIKCLWGQIRPISWILHNRNESEHVFVSKMKQ